MGAGASYPAATARGCPGKVEVGAPNLRGLPDCRQPLWRMILMITGSITESRRICVDVCLCNMDHK